MRVHHPIAFVMALRASCLLTYTGTSILHLPSMCSSSIVWATCPSYGRVAPSSLHALATLTHHSHGRPPSCCNQAVPRGGYCQTGASRQRGVLGELHNDAGAGRTLAAVITESRGVKARGSRLWHPRVPAICTCMARTHELGCASLLNRGNFSPRAPQRRALAVELSRRAFARFALA